MPEETRYNYQAVYQCLGKGGVFEGDRFCSFPCTVQTNPARLNHRMPYSHHRARAEPAGSESTRFEEGVQNRNQSSATLHPYNTESKGLGCIFLLSLLALKCWSVIA